MWIEIAGWGGMILVLIAYFLSSTGRLKNESAFYHWINFFGAIGIIINAYYKTAWAVMTMDVIWAGIAIAGLLRIRKTYDAV